MKATDSVRKWYVKEFGTDELGKEINPSVSFSDVLSSMRRDMDVYETIGVGDSIVRERVFCEIAELYGVDYDEVYNLWLNGKENVSSNENFVGMSAARIA